MLMDRHVGWVYAAARRRVRDEHLAHDVAQAVFILLSERAGKLRDLNQLGPWLLQTTAYTSNHAMREESRRRKRERIVAAARAEADPSDERSVAFSSEMAVVENAVEKLGPDDRTLIVLRFYQGMALADVGAELGISQDAARKRVDRALKRLRHRLGRDEQYATVLGPLLAAVAGGGSPPARPSQTITSINRASPRAVSISKGVSHMLLRNRIKQVAVFASLSLVLGAGIALAFHDADGGEGPPPATAVKLTQADRRTVENNRGSLIVSPDGTKLTGYSKTTGKWAQVDGKGFTTDRAIVGGSIMIYSAPDRCYAFSPSLGTWSSIDLPPHLDKDHIIGPAISDTMAAVAVPGFVYACSETTGKWETLVTTGDKPAECSVSPGCVTVYASGKVYYCDSTTGKWSPGF